MHISLLKIYRLPLEICTNVSAESITLSVVFFTQSPSSISDDWGNETLPFPICQGSNVRTDSLEKI